MTNNNDILLDENYNLLASDGDLVTGDCLIQRQALLLAAGEGEWKQSPVTGIGIEGYLLDESELELFSKIRRQFKSDGISANKLVKSPDGNLIINSQYA